MKGTVGELGEFGLIRELTSRLTTTPAVRVGPGDDAAVVAAPDRRVVASTDILLEGRHFRRDWSTAYDVGRKAAAQNLADIAAMGAVPTALLLGLVVPAELPVTWPSELMDGIRDECQVAGASVVGGDVVRGDTIMVSITALGDLRNQEPVTRAAVPTQTGRAADAALPQVRSVSLPVDGSFTGPSGTVHVKGTLDVTVVTLPGAAGGGTAQVISSLDATTGDGLPSGKTYYLVGAHRDTAPFSAAATTTFHIKPALLLVPPSGAPGRVQPLTVSVTVTSTGVIDTVTAAVG